MGPSRSLARNIVRKDLMAPKFGEFDSDFLRSSWTTTVLKCASKYEVPCNEPLFISDTGLVAFVVL